MEPQAIGDVFTKEAAVADRVSFKRKLCGTFWL